MRNAGIVVGGWVRDAETDHPLVNANVALDTHQGANSDSAGHFRVEDVSPGRHRIRVLNPAYYPSESLIDVPRAGYDSLVFRLRLVRVSHYRVVIDTSSRLEHRDKNR